ncbi:MAG: hypothetical protein NZ728_06585, partial [Oleiphilaceae bacterium]|nr:hypothetical protein [Oleiphilaceae bacterium]
MTFTNKFVGAGALAALLTTPAFAQGDDCSVATAINGAGNWAYDTTAATISGFSGGSACTNAGSLDVGPDQFFQWTADAAGSWQIDTCGSAYDTKLNAHSGAGCAAICTAYNDDGACGNFHSVLVLSGVAIGDTFVIQVGGWNGLAGIGVLNTAPLGAPGTNDDCGIADVIGGYGIWAFNTTGASTTGFSGGSACTAAGSLDMGPDQFWQWTATAAGDVEIKLEGSLYDTKLNVHTGVGCAATCVAYNDDSYGLQSAVTLTGVSNGDTFLIQIGGFAGSFGPGTMEILPYIDPCAGVPDDAFEDNDTCATATSIGDGFYPALMVFEGTDLDMFTFTVADGATFQANAFNPGGCGIPDVDMFLYDVASGFCNDDPTADPVNGGELANAWTCIDDEVLVWTNGTGSDVECVLRVSVWPQAPLDGCSPYDLTIAGAGPGGPTLFCSPANVHSGGGSATLAISSVSGPGLYHLEAIDGPIDQFGYFLVSAGSMDPGVSVSQGELCLTAPIGRYSPAAGGSLNSIGRFDTAGVLLSLAGNSSVGSGYDVPAALPSPPGGVIGIGATWHFQLWYRDGAASNFSDGISVT